MKKSELRSMIKEAVIEALSEMGIPKSSVVEQKLPIKSKTLPIRLSQQKRMPVVENENVSKLRQKLGLPDRAGTLNPMSEFSLPPTFGGRPTMPDKPIVVETKELDNGELFVSGKGILDQMKDRLGGVK